jgi:hypothetical protein
MARVLPIASLLALLAALAAPAAADRVLLTDGRSFTGAVTTDGDTIQIVMEFGTIRVSRAEVASIEIGDTPDVVLAKKLATIPADNAPALCEVAKWAAANNLPRQADELFAKVLRLDPDNAAAHAALGHARIDGEWRTFAQGLELARNKLEAGQVQSLLLDVLPALDGLAHGKDKHLAIQELAALAQLRGAKISAATRAFEELAGKAAPPSATRFTAIAEILKENPDGLYILAEPYPPAGNLLGGEQPSVKAGPASLTDPRVLQAALADRAKKDIQAARLLLDQIRMVGDSETFKARSPAANRAMDRAEALSPGIARSYRVELVRLRIEGIRKDTDQQAKDFDKEMASLGKSDLAPGAYRSKVQKMIALLDSIHDGLKEINDVAKPFPRDLVLDAKWADLDLKKIKEMRDVLTGELDARK